VLRDDLQVHHVDEDRKNDASENLVATHGPCHTRHHLKGKKKTPEHAANISKGKLAANFHHSGNMKEQMSKGHRDKGIRPSDDAIAKRAEQWKGGNHTPETVAKMSEKARNRTPEHQEKLNAAHRGKKRSKESREKMRQAALRRVARQRAEKAAEQEVAK
jgi:hypothetical protein